MEDKTATDARERLKVNETGAVELRTAQDAIQFATWCYESGYLPDHVRNPKQAFVILQRGAEMGLPAFASWRYIYQTRGGKLALESKGALAVVQSKPTFADYQERIEGKAGPAEKWIAVAVAERKGHKPTIKEFSYKDAEAAGLTRRPKNRQGQEYDSPWQSYLADMLLSKARERALSICFAAELGGIPIEGLAEEIEAREAVRVEVKSGLRERMAALPKPAKALPEGGRASMTELIRGKDFVPAAEAVEVESEEAAPAEDPMEAVIEAQVDKAAAPEKPEEEDPKLFPEPE